MKVRFIYGLVLFFLFVSTLHPLAALPGDADENGVVNIIDALLVAKFSLDPGLSLSRENSDVNLDEIINIIDALLIAKYSIGLINELPYVHQPTPTPFPEYVRFSLTVHYEEPRFNFVGIEIPSEEVNVTSNFSKTYPLGTTLVMDVNYYVDWWSSPHSTTEVVRWTGISLSTYIGDVEIVLDRDYDIHAYYETSYWNDVLP